MPLATKAAKIRSLLPWIEAALADGVGHQQILSQLNDAGFDLTLEYYKLILKRLRKAAKQRPVAPVRQLGIGFREGGPLASRPSQTQHSVGKTPGLHKTPSSDEEWLDGQKPVVWT